ncbi:UNVERIFIED_CONTAM: hypothetical protein Sindi_1078100 [Sesamum indicum]
MDTSLLLHRPAAPKPKLKRPCCSHIPDSTRNPNQNPLDALLESFLELSDSSAIALDLSFDRVLESKAYDSDKNDVIERALRLGSALTEAAKRSARRRASMHNAVVWALPSDLTIKDVSNREGLASDDDWYRRCFTPSFMSLRELLEERPNLCVLADFPAEGSFVEEPMTSSDLNSDTNSPSLSSSRTSDEYVLASPSDSSYSSDQSSGNEDSPSSGYPIHEESSDEACYHGLHFKAIRTPALKAKPEQRTSPYFDQLSLKWQ